MSTAAVKRILRFFCPVADDATGHMSVPPGIESDRRVYEQMEHWEGEGLPPHPDQPIVAKDNDEPDTVN